MDVPEIDTVLLLRPTESATVFLQQLGRGLRLAEGKDCLTVLDFIGQQHKRFRFDLRLRALTGAVAGRPQASQIEKASRISRPDARSSSTASREPTSSTTSGTPSSLGSRAWLTR